MTADADPGAPTRSRSVRIAAVAVGGLMVLLVALLAGSKISGDRSEPSPVLNEQAPALGGKAYLGKPFDIGLNDRWLVVNFFATWCTPCVQEHPELVAFAKEHEAIGDARVISVVYGDKATAVRDFFKAKGGTWTVLDDDNGRTPFDWGVAKVPESFLVRGDGLVIARFQSGVTRELLDQYIEAASAPSDDAPAASTTTHPFDSGAPTTTVGP